MVLIIGPLIAVAKAIKNSSRNNARQALMMNVNEIVSAKLDQLTRRRAQLVQPDSYGRLRTDRWLKEIDYFIDNHLVCKLSQRDQIFLQRERSEVVSLITQRTFEKMQAEPVFRAFSDKMSPADFELFCAEQLKTAGWRAEVTLRSRDQGVDIVAEKAGTRVVLQCKLYSGPVGNGAVQEIVAGRAHERAHYGAVVTNNRYTLPAEQLAAANGILLLHFRDLANLETMLTSRTA